MILQRPEVLVNGLGCFSAGLNRPYDQRCTADGITGGEDLWIAGLSIVDDHIASLVQLDAQFFDQRTVFDMDESHRQQNQIGPERKTGSGDFGHFPLTVILFPFHFAGVQFFDAGGVAGEFLAQYAPLSFAALFMA